MAAAPIIVRLSRPISCPVSRFFHAAQLVWRRDGDLGHIDYEGEDAMGSARTIVEHAFEAMTAQDLDRLAALVTPDCDWVDSGTPIQGPEQLRGEMQGLY